MNVDRKKEDWEQAHHLADLQFKDIDAAVKGTAHKASVITFHGHMDLNTIEAMNYALKCWDNNNYREGHEVIMKYFFSYHKWFKEKWEGHIKMFANIELSVKLIKLKLKESEATVKGLNQRSNDQTRGYENKIKEIKEATQQIINDKENQILDWKEKFDTLQERQQHIIENQHTLSVDLNTKLSRISEIKKEHKTEPDSSGTSSSGAHKQVKEDPKIRKL